MVIRRVKHGDKVLELFGVAGMVTDTEEKNVPVVAHSSNIHTANCSFDKGYDNLTQLINMNEKEIDHLCKIFSDKKGHKQVMIIFVLFSSLTNSVAKCQNLALLNFQKEKTLFDMIILKKI